jgi:ferrous iron transport protein A
MRPGERGIVANLNGTGSIHQRLMEMGIIEGSEVEVIRFAPLGDPMEILVQGYHLLLRKSEAALVELND